MQLHVPMTGRDPEEVPRASTPLELFYDLTFVVAVAQAAASLHHGLTEGDTRHALIAFPLVFFAVWWAWVNFTWFASAYDTDDALYRLAVFVQMTGVLILAAGIPRAFNDTNFGVVAFGYVVMRLALVAQWLRAAHSHPEGRTTALRFAAGITVLQIGWLVWLLFPPGAKVAGMLVLAVGEMTMPLWAEGAGRTSWHPSHIAERYGLFTIIVLGESILSATVGVQVALDADADFSDLGTVVVGGLLIVFSLWSTYFDMPLEATAHRARQLFTDHMGSAFLWSYGHYFVFGGAAATGAGLAVAIDQATNNADLSDVGAGFAVTLPVCVYLIAVWLLHYRFKPDGVMRNAAVPVAVVLILASTFSGQAVLLTGLILAALVVANVLTRTSVLPVEDS